ncbi:MAG: ribonuclease HIII [Ktedonobacteraceae bacterium]
MAKKDYQAYQATINDFREFVSYKGWAIAAEKEIDYGYQIVVFDGHTKNSVDFFPSGKILVQGKVGILRNELLSWREGHQHLSALNIEKAQLPFTDVQAEQKSDITITTATSISRIGIDESGKGDYFGPLVIGAVHINKQTEPRLIELGVRDSKLLSDIRILVIAEEIKEICPHSVITIGPKRYNEAYEKIQNLNSLLAWGHARALENVLEKVFCELAIADQFGNEAVLQNALLKKGRQIKLEQRHRAEADVAVAAASILARAEFVQKMEQLAIRLGRTLPKGASDPSIVSVGKEVVARGGKEALAEVAKLHFRTTEKILQRQ